MTIDDVLGMEHLDQVTVSSDGEWVSASVQRPAKAGEVFGRTAYEIDPSRNDVWVISRRTHERRNITQGAPEAAGFWCASWSPDGRRLAMLSTRPENSEPRGGDNVRLYLWERDTDKLTRLGDVAMITQTRYGGAIHRLDLRGGADHSTVPHSCAGEGENAPFLWLDNNRLLAATLPDGQISGLIDEASRPFRIDARDARRLRDGVTPTGEAMGSGAARTLPPAEGTAVIQIVDVKTRQWHLVTSVPSYPFRGDLSLSVSPDGRQLAVLTPVAAFPQAAGRRPPHADYDDWLVEKRLGVTDLRPGATMHWIGLPAATPYPLELYGWSPDSKRLALRARRDAFENKPVLLVASAATSRATQIGTVVLDQEAAGTNSRHEPQLIWIDNQRMLARLHAPADERLDWWRIGGDGTVANLSATWKFAPSALRRLSGGRFVTIAGQTLITFDPRSGRSSIMADLGADGGAFIGAGDPASSPTSLFVGTTDAEENQVIRVVISSGPGPAAITLPATATPLLVVQGRVLWQDGGETGTFLNESDPATGETHKLLSLNTSFASIAWGKNVFFDYRTMDGQAVKGAAILPPDYQPGRRYPTLVWVYEGYWVHQHGDYFLDPQMPGIYNLQLYAAKGYVVLLPSMPLPTVRKDVYAAVTHGVMPAIDKLAEMGIADPDRLGVFGQSYGGYSVYALLSQSGRFKAGVALAGITDLAGYVDQFDPLARGYPDIAHEKSSNWVIADQFGLHVLPTSDRETYERNSPLTHLDQVHTPLLMIHGTDDGRGAVTQAEQFFHGLYMQGKTARLVRYNGEGHSLAQSPANVRDILRETLMWFDRYVMGHGYDRF
ncbi:prolyl oligopeptidase family serine peptidase (plasmid) [Polymorphobacter sp. PAMC 29334]|uniref:S9 family peptidase n=1 Tax=Polymorphobacter sp. PAMC 29334 TaxID=2862331 RepID=UPI001C75F35D|nr:prolyl oligopeptidase family serine peptidase [Polymorphobacter sp. PAMC 29334]QYE37209.1 prolyl oligopeptidase family serine peptidase [Polymorphobacter sp. PAMC 29334]